MGVDALCNLLHHHFTHGVGMMVSSYNGTCMQGNNEFGVCRGRTSKLSLSMYAPLGLWNPRFVGAVDAAGRATPKKLHTRRGSGPVAAMPPCGCDRVNRMPACDVSYQSGSIVVVCLQYHVAFVCAVCLSAHAIKW